LGVRNVPADVTVMSKKRRLRKARQYMREFQEVQERMTDALGAAMARAVGVYEEPKARLH
jgi:hypothetical protein